MFYPLNYRGTVYFSGKWEVTQAPRPRPSTPKGEGVIHPLPLSARTPARTRPHLASGAVAVPEWAPNAKKPRRHHLRGFFTAEGEGFGPPRALWP